MRSKSVFIVFEGIDGTGKTEALSKLIPHLVTRHKEFSSIVLTKEPTCGSTGNKIRKLHRADIKDPELFFRLFCLDRSEHIERTIKPALKTNSLIISDRYAYSTLAYQSVQGIPKKTLQHYSFLKPNLVILFDAPAKTVMKRIYRRKKAPEVFEHTRFLENARQEFLKIAKKTKKPRFVVIDASKNRKTVALSVQKAVEKFLFDSSRNRF
ncbi:MAG: dTMP kinase [Candidatus Diapherotrites archaeon]|uniref:Probable thymidylate kinase n=1 Tax=Candidatus Iainarchaeum sp. TaxID=3101447 RepID=A0A8T4L569_9ARCH|nr:dTMP kinase [Candidatus Diapherotrites archaeon]